MEIGKRFTQDHIAKLCTLNCKMCEFQSKYLDSMVTTLTCFNIRKAKIVWLEHHVIRYVMSRVNGNKSCPSNRNFLYFVFVHSNSKKYCINDISTLEFSSRRNRHLWYEIVVIVEDSFDRNKLDRLFWWLYIIGLDVGCFKWW